MYRIKNQKKNEKILALLRENCRMSVKQIGKRLNMPPTTVYNRIKKMERDGVIKACVALVNHSKMGKPIQSFVHVSLSDTPLTAAAYTKLHDQLIKMQGIEQCFSVSGKYEYLLFVIASDLNELNEIRARIRQLENVVNVDTSIVMTDVIEKWKEKMQQS